MKDDILESVSQRSRGEEIAENKRIYEIADGLRRGCQLYEAQLRNGQSHVSHFDVEQRLVKNAQPATNIEIETYMAAIGFSKMAHDGRYANTIYEVWDLLPRNVLKDKEGDLFVIDAEIKKSAKS